MKGLLHNPGHGQSFSILEIHVKNVQELCEKKGINRSGDNWFYLVPATPPVSADVQLTCFPATVRVEDPAIKADASAWKFYLVDPQDPAHAVLTENMMMTKSKGGMMQKAMKGPLYVTDVKRLVMLNFILSKGKQTSWPCLH